MFSLFLSCCRQERRTLVRRNMALSGRPSLEKYLKLISLSSVIVRDQSGYGFRSNKQSTFNDCRTTRNLATPVSRYVWLEQQLSDRLPTSNERF